MNKSSFVKKFENNDFINDADLLFDLLDTAQEVVKSKFDVAGTPDANVTIRTAELILTLKTGLYDGEEEDN